MIANLLLHALLGITAPAPPPAVCPVKGSIGHCVFFIYERQGSPVPKYTIVVQEDRVAHYWEGDGVYDEAQRAKPALSVSETTLKKIFDAHIAGSSCETHAKNIAQTGKKTLASYDGDEVAECSFNYSDDATVNEAATQFMAMAETMRLGAKLAHDRRFDHLGLNADLDTLALEAKDRRAIELQNISPVLQSIVDDDDMMDVVRRKAKSLLQDASLHPTT